MHRAEKEVTVLKSYSSTYLQQDMLQKEVKSVWQLVELKHGVWNNDFTRRPMESSSSVGPLVYHVWKGLSDPLL